MTTWLYLLTETSEDWEFYHPLKEIINVQVNDYFYYDEGYYNKLNKNEKLQFNTTSLKLGKYQVVSNEIDSENRYIYLRKVND